MAFFDNQRVLITGGSSGIGKACAALALKRGAHVLIVGRRPELLAAAEAELRPLVRPDRTLASRSLDVADEAAVGAAAPEMFRTLGGLDILINNAGVAHVGYLEHETNEKYREMMNINFFGTVWVTQAFLPHFMAQKRGHIGFTSSVLGQMGLFGYSAYCASKFAMTGYADCLRQDLMRYGIGVHVCYPPDTDTPQHTEELRSMPPETRAVAGTITMLAADQVAREFLDGIAGGQYEVLPSFNNRMTMWAVRHLPGLSRTFIDRDIRNAQSAAPQGPLPERLAPLTGPAAGGPTAVKADASPSPGI